MLFDQVVSFSFNTCGSIVKISVVSLIVTVRLCALHENFCLACFYCALGLPVTVSKFSTSVQILLQQY